MEQVSCILSDVVEWARRESESEELIAQTYERDGFPHAAIPHQAASAALERLARMIEIRAQA